MARPPLPDHQRRSETIRVRTTPASKKTFLDTCKKHGYTQTAAVREALGDWVRKMGSKR